MGIETKFHKDKVHEVIGSRAAGYLPGFFPRRYYFTFPHSVARMVILNVAYSEPVNCSDPSTLTLTQEQIWKGLELKARRPQVFIPSFDDSRVLEERENGCYILREAHVASDLRESPMAGKWTREECRLHKPVMVRDS